MDERQYDATIHRCLCCPIYASRTNFTKTHVHMRFRRRKCGGMCCGWTTVHEQMTRKNTNAYVDSPGLRGCEWFLFTLANCSCDRHHAFHIKGSGHVMRCFVDLEDKNNFREQLQFFMEE